MTSETNHDMSLGAWQDSHIAMSVHSKDEPQNSLECSLVTVGQESFAADESVDNEEFIPRQGKGNTRLQQKKFKLELPINKVEDQLPDSTELSLRQLEQDWNRA